LKNLWNDEDAKAYKTDLELRVYSSNLLGQSDELVLHGGGNTSVKSDVNGEEILYVKGSGWDLVSIKEEGFAPVKMSTLLEMAKMKKLSDIDMVLGQKAAMIDKTAPNPSVEAILHAIIPFKVVDHTHADAIVTISNCINGDKLIDELFPNFLIVPYVMPGFILAKTIYELTQNFNWDSCEGIILHNHGILTFDDDAKKSYSKMIEAVTLAENFLEHNAKLELRQLKPKEFDINLLNIDEYMYVNQTPLALNYASQENLEVAVRRGVLTPEHILRTKRVPLVVENDNIQKALKGFIEEYKSYFHTYSRGSEIMLNPNPKYVVVKDFGVVSFGKTQKEANIVNDIVSHTMLAVMRADKLGGYKSISIADSFNMEYWELEQAKLK
jgi:rhamnose utilization protein RhaD (predicted bifunctional aldolase and dehydrogenase)